MKIPVILCLRGIIQNSFKSKFIWKDKWRRPGNGKSNKMNRNSFWQTLKC